MLRYFIVDFEPAPLCVSIVALLQCRLKVHKTSRTVQGLLQPGSRGGRGLVRKHLGLSPGSGLKRRSTHQEGRAQMKTGSPGVWTWRCLLPAEREQPEQGERDAGSFPRGML